MQLRKMLLCGGRIKITLEPIAVFQLVKAVSNPSKIRLQQALVTSRQLQEDYQPI